ncbi:sigma-70 family RNA polymerase sigma factor [Zhihengliuella flava]|uniref:RNA polymerase sigma factor (Sigma-70 family) n=1 Tax=Zhihengliuella flava TaxID=1285193 RepID=A0A931GMH9_9MICC|nr:sigma-70 family RNA polymerase sigma factor [Zhihengliuella flava]MBG6085444.1 RNA polymerase sigma factor (sigma-70 family) [Zhihengliuella flava]
MLFPEEERSDAELIAAVRAGDDEAFGELYARHQHAALRTAKWRLNAGSTVEADDVVADAFSSMLTTLRRGKGPTEAFRPYLLTVVSRTALAAMKKSQAELKTDSIELFESGTDHADPVMDGFESQLLGRAFRSLPQQWQLVLWHVELEGEKPADVASLIGAASPNAVSALAVRAREGLRAAYLQAHVSETTREECAQADQFAKYVRGTLTPRKQAAFSQHLEDCPACFSALGHLEDVSSAMRSVIGPLFVGVGSAGLFVWLTPAGAAAGAAAVGAAIPKPWWQSAGLATAGAVAATGIVLGVTGLAAGWISPTADDAVAPTALSGPAEAGAFSASPSERPQNSTAVSGPDVVTTPAPSAEAAPTPATSLPAADPAPVAPPLAEVTTQTEAPARQAQAEAPAATPTPVPETPRSQASPPAASAEGTLAAPPTPQPTVEPTPEPAAPHSAGITVTPQPEVTPAPQPSPEPSPLPEPTPEPEPEPEPSLPSTPETVSTAPPETGEATSPESPDTEGEASAESVVEPVPLEPSPAPAEEPDSGKTPPGHDPCHPKPTPGCAAETVGPPGQSEDAAEPEGWMIRVELVLP